MSLPKEGSRDVHDGIIVSMVPDICLTPVGGGMVPVPYTIWCRQADAANLANSVRQTDDRSHAVASVVLHCYGDEPGTGGGIVSGTIGAECTPKTWSQTVRVEGRNMVRHDDQWWMNHRNTYGKLIYTKDLNSYDLSKPEEIVAQMRAQPTARNADAASEPQTSQVAQAGTAVAGGGAVAGGSAGGGGITIPSPWQVAKGGARALGGAIGGAAVFYFGSTTSTASNDQVRVSKKNMLGCCIAPHKENKKTGCKNCNTKGKLESHHGVIDYPFRTGSRNEPGHTAPGAPSLNNAYTICVPQAQHRALHKGLNSAISAAGKNGVVSTNKVMMASYASILALPSSTLSKECKAVYMAIMGYQYRDVGSDTLLRSDTAPQPRATNQAGQTLSKNWGFKW